MVGLSGIDLFMAPSTVVNNWACLQHSRKIQIWLRFSAVAVVKLFARYVKMEGDRRWALPGSAC
jgi:hypothetical protein